MATALPQSYYRGVPHDLVTMVEAEDAKVSNIEEALTTCVSESKLLKALVLGVQKGTRQRDKLTTYQEACVDGECSYIAKIIPLTSESDEKHFRLEAVLTHYASAMGFGVPVKTIQVCMLGGRDRYGLMILERYAGSLEKLGGGVTPEVLQTIDLMHDSGVWHSNLTPKHVVWSGEPKQFRVVDFEWAWPYLSPMKPVSQILRYVDLLLLQNRPVYSRKQSNGVVEVKGVIPRGLAASWISYSEFESKHLPPNGPYVLGPIESYAMYTVAIDQLQPADVAIVGVEEWLRRMKWLPFDIVVPLPMMQERLRELLQLRSGMQVTIQTAISPSPLAKAESPAVIDFATLNFNNDGSWPRTNALQRFRDQLQKCDLKVETVNDFAKALITVKVETKVSNLNMLKLQDDRKNVCEHGQTTNFSNFQWAVVQKYHNELDLPFFIVIEMTVGNGLTQVQMENRMAAALLLSQLHAALTGSHFPIVIVTLASQHAMIEYWHRSSDSWTATWVNPSTYSDRKIAEKKESVMALTGRAFAEYLKLAGVSEQLHRRNCESDFQGGFGTCTQWSFGIGVYFLYLQTDDLNGHWCKMKAQRSRLEAERLLHHIERMIDVFSSALLELTDEVRLGPVQLNHIRRAVLDWIGSVVALDGKSEAVMTLDEEHWTKFIDRVQTEAQLTSGSDSQTILKVCIPKYIERSIYPSQSINPKHASRSASRFVTMKNVASTMLTFT